MADGDLVTIAADAEISDGRRGAAAFERLDDRAGKSVVDQDLLGQRVSRGRDASEGGSLGVRAVSRTSPRSTHP